MSAHLKRLRKLRANCSVTDANYVYADALDEAIAALEALPRLRRIEAAAQTYADDDSWLKLQALRAALSEEP